MMINKRELLQKCEHLSDDDRALIAKALDQCLLAYKRNIPAYTDFLDRQKIALIQSLTKDVDMGIKVIGGYDDAERCYLCFYKELYSDIDDKHNIIKITPKLNKFTKSKINHRDFLGAILGLGLRRDKIGDLIIDEENNAYVFAKEDISEFIEISLHAVGRISVSTEVLFNHDIKLPQPKFKEINVTVSSLRLDALISRGFSMSRSDATGYIKGGKAFVNWVNVTSSSKSIQAGDRISVRGFGKMKIHHIGRMTKKERIHVTIHRYC